MGQEVEELAAIVSANIGRKEMLFTRLNVRYPMIYRSTMVKLLLEQAPAMVGTKNKERGE